MREGLGVRDVTDFCNWWLERNTTVEEGKKPPTVAKSAWDRHKNNDHFVLEERKELPTEGRFTTVEAIASEMVRRYGAQLEDPNYLPSDRDVREWAALMGKLDDLEQRRRDEQKLMALMAGAAFKKPTVIDVTPAPIPIGEASD